MQYNLDNIWLPYTQMKNCELPLAVKSASDCYIELQDGRKLLDGISSWWSVCHGYQQPHIVAKMQEQLANLSHVMFAGLAHEPAYKLAERLVKFTPEGLQRVFFADSGSSAVEIAMKMAVQFWGNNGNKRKSKFIAFKNGYHGDTMGAISLTDPNGWVAKAFNNYAPRQFFLDIPNDEYSLSEFRETVKSIADNVAAIIIEPLVQGAGGMKFHSPDILYEIHKIAKENNILFIADEIMTGFYRTGNKFACDEAGICPDIMTIGKSLTGGMISLAATLATNEIFEAFLADEMEKAFMHGPTFMANPLACAAANASLDLFEKENFIQKTENIESFFRYELNNFQDHPAVKSTRVKGAIAVIELTGSDAETWRKCLELRKAFVERNIWLRPFKNIIYLMPSYTISEGQIVEIFTAIEDVI